MGHYTHKDLDLNRRRSQPHPIWRGLGCFIIPIVPIVAYGLAYLLVDSMLARGTAIPRELLGYPKVPDLLFKIPGLTGILSWIASRNNLYLYIVTTGFMTLLVTGVFSSAYAILYRLVGPPQYSPLDAPPPKIRIRKKSR